MELKVSIVVCTFNQLERLEKCIDSLLDQTASHDICEIIIVNDGSSDDTESYINYIKEVEDNIIYIVHDKNLGLCTSRNDGIKIAHGTILISSDSDIILDRYFVEKHIKYHKQYVNEHIAVQGNISLAPEFLNGSNFANYVQSRNLGFRSHKDKISLNYSNLPPRYFMGGLSSTRRSDLLKVGMYDPNLRYYGGKDGDMGFRLSQIGVRMIFGEEARALHFDNVSLPRYKTKVMENAREAHRYLFAKNHKFFEDTPLRFLQPINRSKDSLRLILMKFILKIILNPINVIICEQWAVLTDKYSLFYFSLLYKYLEAGWYRQGLLSKQKNIRKVVYNAGKDEESRS